MNARKSDIEPTFVEARDLLKNPEKLSNTLVSTQVRVKIGRPNQDLWVTVDHSQFVAAMLKLIKNGADAMGRVGRVHVGAKTRTLNRAVVCQNGSTLPPNEYIVFSVTDNGCGISDENISLVAEPFCTTKPVGSGMGLSMVTGFATRSDGGLRILASTDGTKVEILLPRTNT